MKTSFGNIQLELYPKDAPKTVQNFLTLTQKGFYDGTKFHRVIPGFMIQGGDPNSKDNDWSNDGMGGPGYTFADELNPQTPSYQQGYTRGTLAMANAGPNTNGSQFFIMQADQALPHNYTIFGHVLSGMDVVDQIVNLPRNQNDHPTVDAVIRSVTVE
ncbi:MAG: peptidylprolyl isomerase [Patescibacteria group bacterium]|nr:peptidylprolyl isomerase [Patescibacteria group bacterium]